MKKIIIRLHKDGGQKILRIEKVKNVYDTYRDLLYFGMDLRMRKSLSFDASKRSEAGFTMIPWGISYHTPAVSPFNIGEEE